jgi:hypothetical protein
MRRYARRCSSEAARFDTCSIFLECIKALWSHEMHSIGALQQFVLELEVTHFLRCSKRGRPFKRTAFFARCDPISRGCLKPRMSVGAGAMPVATGLAI